MKNRIITISREFERLYVINWQWATQRWPYFCIIISFCN